MRGYRTAEGLRGDVVEVVRCQARERGLEPQEQVVVNATGWSGMQQVVRDRLADIGEQRQAEHPVRLVLDNRGPGLAPVDVCEAHPRDVHGTQAGPGRQKQHRPVPAPRWGRPVSGVDQLIDTTGR